MMRYMEKKLGIFLDKPSDYLNDERFVARSNARRAVWVLLGVMLNKPSDYLNNEREEGYLK